MSLFGAVRSWIAKKIDARNACDRGNHTYGEWKTHDDEFNMPLLWGGKKVALRECKACDHREARIQYDDRNFPATEIDVDGYFPDARDHDHNFFDFGNCDVLNHGPYPDIRDHPNHWNGTLYFVMMPGHRFQRVPAETPEQALQKFVQNYLDIRAEHGDTDWFDDGYEWDDERIRVIEAGPEFTFNRVRLKDGWRNDGPDEDDYSEYPRREKLAGDPTTLF